MSANHKDYNMIISISLLVLTLLIMVNPIEQLIYAAPASSASTSGYSRGCSDSQISNPADRYIKQPGKGASFHSKAFMQAYNAGFGACSHNSNIDSGVGGSINNGSQRHQSYWTPSNATVPPDLKKYHLFLYGVNPSWIQTNDENRRIAKLANEGLKVCIDFSARSDKPSVCHPIKHIPSTPTNITIDAGYFVVPSNLNDSHGNMWTKIRYEEIGVGHSLNGTIGRMDMDDIYQEVITVRSCVEDQHIKINSDKFHECYEGAG